MAGMISVELSLALFGLTGIAVYLTLLTNRSHLPPAVFESLRGGHFGALAMGISVIGGLLAFPLFLLNIAIGLRSQWVLRSIVLFVFLVLVVILGSML